MQNMPKHGPMQTNHSLIPPMPIPIPIPIPLPIPEYTTQHAGNFSYLENSPLNVSSSPVSVLSPFPP